MSRRKPRRGACRVALRALIAIGAFAAASAIADPSEDNPEAAARDPDYAAGKQALEKKNWPEAAKRFQQAALRDPDNPDLQNYLGYSYRNLGQFDLAFKYYNRALVLSPRHRGAHEYLGEAYLMVGNLAGAEKHLAALRDICLVLCEEIADLERAIAEYRTKSTTPALVK